MHRLILLAALPLTACMKGGVLVPSDDTGDPQADTDADSDADTDTDTDTDTDADADADADADSDADADPQPQVDCGPYEPPSSAGSVYSGEGELLMVEDWWWDGCEVERRFEGSGTLDCEILYAVEGYYYDWEEWSMTAWYALDFRADQGESTCSLEEWERRYTVYYEASFDWDHDEMELSWSDNANGGFDHFATAEIGQSGNVAPFSYISGLF